MAILNHLPTTLNFIAEPQLIQHCIDGAFMAKTGLAGNFRVNNWPFEYLQFVKKTSRELSDILKTEGKNIDPLTTDDVDSLWPTASKFWGQKISDSWGGSIEIPGIKSLKMSDFEPITPEAINIIRNYAPQEVDRELRMRLDNLILPDLLGRSREIMYYVWRTNWDLHREGEDPMKEMKALKTRRKEMTY